ncbi:MAG: fibrillarin-like rRNA/tRNA 2'-O-methyltransferase [Thaumarchaeota archaeon]|nr:fibrillarin-like rRNA/tRNA 2'-O-methyltransferase [Nitrososphaerota archaeon]
MKEEEGRAQKLRWVTIDNQQKLATENFVAGNKVYDERFVSINGIEYRVWDPFRSKLAAAITKGLELMPIGEGSSILYVGASTGTTVSHVSDIIGKSGIVYGVEVSARVAREFIENVAEKRSNIIPIVADARKPKSYGVILSKVDVVYADIAQPDQTQITIQNCQAHLKRGGYLLMVVKSRSIDVTKEPREVFLEESRKLQDAGFTIKQVLKLEPFDKDHAIILAHML